MGMFDSLTCEYPLPRPDMHSRTFQTKDLGCMLDSYVIRASGELFIQAYGYEQVEAPESRIGFRLRRVNEHWERIDDEHGDVYFYDFQHLGIVDSPLITFRARFTHGRVESIIEVDDAP